MQRSPNPTMTPEQPTVQLLQQKPHPSILNRVLRRIILRPSIWVAIITTLAYWDTRALHGTFVYDDAGSIINNVVVNGQVPWTDAFTRDFWGTLMSLPQSHKSFRPVTSLSFKLNWLYAEQKIDQTPPGTKTDPKYIQTYTFHLVNVLLHAMVTALVTEASAYVFIPPTARQQLPIEDGDSYLIAQLITGLVFGLHPVHVEAVTNITSRGEMLMSLFFLSAFLVYVNYIPRSVEPTKNVLVACQTYICLYVLPCLFLTLSVFSKEQGATTLIALIIYDFIQNHVSVVDYIKNAILYYRTNQECGSTLPTPSMLFLNRALILAMQNAAVALWRYYLNGATQPDFVSDQNPAGMAKDRFTRVFSVSWVYCLYIWDSIYPVNLGPDWSGKSIDLIESFHDRRIIGVLLLWTFAVVCVYSLIFGIQPSAVDQPVSKNLLETRRILLISFFGFLCCPFLLSSNLLVVVGLMKADRVIYLPLMGFALLEALLVKKIFFPQVPMDDSKSTGSTRKGSTRRDLGYLLVLLQLTCFSAKLHERNVAWSHSLNLWTAAFMVNSRSHHTRYNCGYELSLKQRYAEAEYVLRPIGNPRVDGPTNTFVYAMVLYNLQRCDEAQPLLDEAFLVIEENRRTGGPRNVESNLIRTKSNLLVAQAFCTSEIQKSAQTFFNAVQIDPTNDYAVDQANKMVQQLEQWKITQQQQSRHGSARK
jgi:protein O-mannosyl-transferase